MSILQWTGWYSTITTRVLFLMKAYYLQNFMFDFTFHSSPTWTSSLNDDVLRFHCSSSSKVIISFRDLTSLPSLKWKRFYFHRKVVSNLISEISNFAAESGTACTSVQHISNIQHIQGGAADLSQSRTLSMVWHFIDVDLLERRLNTRDLFPSLIGSYFLFLHLTANNSPTCRL